MHLRLHFSVRASSMNHDQQSDLDPYCLQHGLQKKFEPWREISNNVVCVTSKSSDQPAYTCSLIRSLFLSLEYSISVKLLTEHHLEFLLLKVDCTDTSESTLVKIPHCWKSHVAAHILMHTRLHLAWEQAVWTMILQHGLPKRFILNSNTPRL